MRRIGAPCRAVRVRARVRVRFPRARNRTCNRVAQPRYKHGRTWYIHGTTRYNTAHGWHSTVQGWYEGGTSWYTNVQGWYIVVHQCTRVVHHGTSMYKGGTSWYINVHADRRCAVADLRRSDQHGAIRQTGRPFGAPRIPKAGVHTKSTFPLFSSPSCAQEAMSRTWAGRISVRLLCVQCDVRAHSSVRQQLDRSCSPQAGVAYEAACCSPLQHGARR